MHRHFIGIILLVWALVISIAGATIPPVIPNSFVQDHANVLSPEDRAKLEAQLREFQQKWNVEFCVATVRTTGDVDKFDYSLQMTREYGIGSKDNEKRGLLLFLATDDRKWQFQISRHMEAVLTDGQAGSIGRSALVPKLKIASTTGKSADWFNAMSTTVATTYTQVKNNIEPEQITPPPPTDYTGLWVILGILGLGSVGGGIGLHVYSKRQREEERQQQIQREERWEAERKERAKREAERERKHLEWLNSPEGREHTRKEKEARLAHEKWLNSPAGKAETKRLAEEERKRRKREEEEEERESSYRSSYSNSSYSSSSSSSSSDSGSFGGFGGGGDFGGGGAGGDW